MLTLIATIFIVYFVWIVVRPLLTGYIRRKYREKINDMFNQAFGMGGQSPYSTGQGSARREAPRRQTGKKKIFSRDEGEYIEFEEIEVRTEYEAAASVDKSAYTPREPQVSDADWEEIR